MIGISIVVASCGREMLGTLLPIVSAQMVPGDELLVDVNMDGNFGNSARNRLMARAREGNGIVFLDDDDEPLPMWLESMRNAYIAAPDRMHMFQMMWRGSVLWRIPQVLVSNVSTQMICVPRSWALMSQWSDRYEGDYDFIKGLANCFGDTSIDWHDEVLVVHNGLNSPVDGIRPIS